MSGVFAPGAMSCGLPTLQCLLQLCDIERLTKELISCFALYDPQFGSVLYSAANRRRARARFVLAVQEMRTLELDPSPPEGWVLAPAERFLVRGSRPYIQHRMCLLLLQRPFNRGSLDASLCDISLEPWARVLAVGVDWQGSWTCCDRYRALASAVWDLTRLGYSSKQNNPSAHIRAKGCVDLGCLVEAQNALLVTKDYDVQYRQRLQLLARRMNDCALDDFCERMAGA